MNLIEWNKVVGALLATIMFIVVVGIVADDLFEIAQPEVKGYKVEGVEAAPIDEIVAAIEEVEEGPSLADLLANASAEKGARIFARCAACHSVEEGGRHGIGPNLYAIVGAKVARHTNFGYSEALEGHGGSWGFALLDAYIEKPSDAIPGNRMGFAGIDRANQRADLIAYLRLQAADPVPLPEAAPGPEAEQPTEVVSDPEPAQEAEAEEMAEAVVEEGATEPETETITKEVTEEAPEAAAEEMVEEALEISPLATALAAASAERGEAAFATCAICHSSVEGGAHKIGPNLYGVVGAPVGRHADFSYSPALSGDGGSWSYDRLDAFLSSPSEAIPGNRMPFGGIKSLAGRADLILYLRSLSAAPPDLPE